ncbi:SpoIIE family protein phosphatase [Blastopirellula marina]|nr:SpoIIE family protein phosphatase [Blastopirellula marina]
MMTQRTLETGQYVRSALGHFVGGDVAIVEPQSEFIFLALVDVLGHGPQAHHTAIEIEAFIRAWENKHDLLGLLAELHQQHIHGRGAVIGLCTIQPDSGEIRYVGIGNATCRMVGENSRHLLTREGVVGQSMRTPSLEVATLVPGDLLLLHSDGVSSRFELDDCPQLRIDSMPTSAKRIVMQFGRAHDDASCIAVRYA